MKRYKLDMKIFVSAALISWGPAAGIFGQMDSSAPPPNELSDQVSSAQDAMMSNAMSPMVVWSRQSHEAQKSQELTGLLERLAGSGKVGLHVQYAWPDEVKQGRSPLEPAQINALIVLEGGSGGVDMQLVENLASRVLGLSVERGDKVEIYTLARKAAWKELFLSPPAILDLIKFFIIVCLGLLILLTLSRSSERISVSLERLATETRTHDIDVTLSPKPQADAVGAQTRARLASMAQAASSEIINLSSAFSRSDPEMLARVLEEENSRSIAIFISALESDIAGKVLSSLSPAKQEEVALTLPQMVEPDPKEVAQLQAQIHLKLRKLVLEKK
ncbi:MAG: hypothetical protein HY547_05970 [Elusimicrobia bacterium]|nr:hypothetical protein [Elusimicrobiota bacterium]